MGTIINSAVGVVGAALAIAAPLHHSAGRLAAFHHRAATHPDSAVVENSDGARCVVHLGQGRVALVALTDEGHMSELHAWFMALGQPDTAATAIVIVALPGGLADTTKQRIRAGYHDRGGVRVLLDWGGGVVHHDGQMMSLPMVAVIGADAKRESYRSGRPDSASVRVIGNAIATAVREASMRGESAPPIVRCAASLHSA